jgi:hypothetical protein
MTNSVLEQLGIAPMRVIGATRPKGPIASLTNYSHCAVINLTGKGSTKQFMVRMGVRNEGSRKSYILWGHTVGDEMSPFRYQDPDYFEVFAREIADKAPNQASWYSGGTQEERCFATAEGSTFKYRQRTFTRLTAAELAAFNENTYEEITP